MKQLAEKENEIKNLRIILSREKQTLEAARQELEQLDEKITKARTRWTTSMTAAVYLKRYCLEDFKNAYQSIKKLLTDEVITGSKQAHLPKVLGFRLALPQPQDQKKLYVLLCYSDQKYLVPMGDTPNGNARRVINMLKEFDKTLTEVKEALNKANDRKRELLEMIANPDDTYAQRIAECEQEVAELRELITQNTQCA
jgi:chromosome segregation ATPase